MMITRLSNSMKREEEGRYFPPLKKKELDSSSSMHHISPIYFTIAKISALFTIK